MVDRDTAGSGMSSRSSALIRMHYTFRPEVELAVRSDAMFDAWTELTGRPAFVRRTGFARIVLPGEEDALRANVAMQRALRRPGRGHATPPGFAALAPGLRTDDLTECAPGSPTAVTGTARWSPGTCWPRPGSGGCATGRTRRSGRCCARVTG